jgi:hypothetical protein
MSESSVASVYQFKVTLKGSKPAIWRRIQVKSDTTLYRFHKILQVVLDWWDYHLHEFVIHGEHYGTPSPEFGDKVKSDRKVKLSQVISSAKDKFVYEYDFGDGWEHTILLEKILPLDEQATYPVCLDGKLACPPEDCGGMWGYYDFLKAIHDPKHPQHKEMLDWIGGGFDPEEFDLDAINKRL